MSKAKIPAEPVGAQLDRPKRVPTRGQPKNTGTDMAAFYEAQREAAADSRDYAARRRQR
jgi:hypothetical protein